MSLCDSVTLASVICRLADRQQTAAGKTVMGCPYQTYAPLFPLIFYLLYPLAKYIPSNQVHAVDTCNVRVGGERGVEDAVPPVIVVLEKENVLDQRR